MKTEAQLAKEYGWSKKEIKMARGKNVEVPKGVTLWKKKPSKRPKNLWSVVWTDDGVEFLKAFMMVKGVVQSIDTYIGPNGDSNGRLEEFTCLTGTPKDLAGTEWKGRVISNRYPNARIMKVENKNGIEVMAYCRNARLWKVGDEVEVDSQRAYHMVRSQPPRGFNR